MMQNETSKNWNNFALGLIVALLPWLGLPLGWKRVVFTLAGLLIALFSLARVRSKPAKSVPIVAPPANPTHEPPRAY